MRLTGAAGSAPAGGDRRVVPLDGRDSRSGHASQRGSLSETERNSMTVNPINTGFRAGKGPRRVAVPIGPLLTLASAS